MLSKSLQILRSKKYQIYRQPYQLNIVGYRSRFVRSNHFDDEIHVFYTNDQGKWVYHIFKATTDPGQYWLDHPIHPQGTAFLKKGQYQNAFGIGLHRGVYPALVQKKDVNVIRNYKRKGLFKWFESGIEDRGRFGINIHRARKQGTTKVIDNFSAGCLVFANAEDYNLFMNLTIEHQKRYGNSFTVTLVDFRDERRRRLQKIAWGSMIAGGGLLVINRLN
ncbi:hypothetical protein U6A24_18385 [Aquimarina gracilis]|uniref:L,D-transpeptidase-like protein n=1 Tax=Aquimarina gracilis TaxID=874422 RepID=A0ABU6A057_9FLAO|nr:hypothetical protein [Aquimarina gracilis]MEB3347450.1 hypothetical protein [Aquimarina gracilis]